MPGQWLNHAGDHSRRVAEALDGAWQGLAQPQRARRLRQLIIAMLLLWTVFSLAQLLWALLPGKPAERPGNPVLLNPIGRETVSSAPAVDIEELSGLALFGKLDADLDVVRQQQRQAEEAARRRSGIEQGARETRLDLRLVGIVASTEDGAGHAVIEHRRSQEVYAVDDKLPVTGRVTLAKVMPQQVVLDNGGTYELLKLFDGEELSAQVAKPAASPRETSRAKSAPVVLGAGASDLARDYRDRLYSNPRSLAEVVRVTAVREGQQLLGYRVAPGKERAQFETLGLREGDLVTAINGISLDDPSNTVRLYQAMRTAQQATFDIQRDGRAITVSVNMTESGTGG